MEYPFQMSEILSRLMFEKKIKIAELARQVKLPQPTVHRIVTGASTKPHLASLLPLARYFGISVEQLRGLAPIPWLNPQEKSGLITTTSWLKIPCISWEQVTDWCDSDMPKPSLHETVFCDLNVNENSFALRMDDASMSPQFPIGTLLIIDLAKSVKDRGFVVVKLHSMPVAIFRQLFIDGSQMYIKSVSPEFDRVRMTLLGEQDYICGVLVQSKLNFLD